MRVQGTSEAADELRNALESGAKQLADECFSFLNKLSALEASCRDESYDEMRQSTIQAANMVKAVFTPLKDVCDRLRAYSDFLSSHGSAGASGAGMAVAAAVRAGGSGADALDSLLAPSGTAPRALEKTRFGYAPDGHGAMVYDSPNEMSKYLYAKQGSAYVNFQGTCGLCSCANLLRLAGVSLGEKEMIDYASVTRSGGLFSPKLCSTSLFHFSANGGTSAESRQKVLEHFGIQSDVVPVLTADGSGISGDVTDRIAEKIENGHGVILSVHANVLNGRGPGYDDFHAITVTSVTRDMQGNVVGFHVCDSNCGTVFYSADRIRRSLTGNPMNVTRKPIR